jgi:phage baseplate assembly protein W
MASEIAVPFRLSANRGIQAETNLDRQVHQHVLSLVSTELGERLMLPDYGIRLASLLFEEDTGMTARAITDQVGLAFNTWEPGVRLNRAVPVKGDIGEVRVDVDYTRRESPLSSTEGQRVNRARIGIGGQVTEVVRG